MIHKYTIYASRKSLSNKRIFNLVLRNAFKRLMHIILAVTNDISTDQRLIRTARTLHKMQAHISVIGRRFHGEKYVNDTHFDAIRMNLVFNKGPLFYAEYNIRLFFRLLVMKADILVSNDLDTLPAVYLASGIKNTPLVYDSHEYFTEVPELNNRRLVRRIWEKIESLMLPHIQFSSTVSLPIAEAYKKKYNIHMEVIRNLPFRKTAEAAPEFTLQKQSGKTIIYQGALNMGRGLEMAIKAMQYTENLHLVIIGRGDLETQLKELVQSLGLTTKVTFTGSISPEKLFDYTVQADLGISLEEDLGLNYRFALPNKVFDYIQAGVPVLVSDLPEVKSLVLQYDVGMINNTGTPAELGALFNRILGDETKIQAWKLNLKKAASELCWENEEQKLIKLYQSAISDRAS
jgi:glycosyltransferase involved in cell wall biosynthesis